MKLKIIISSALLTITILVGYFAVTRWAKFEREYDNSVVVWVQNESGVDVPIGSTLIELYAGMEYGKLLKYKLDRDVIDSFISNNGLIPIRTHEAQTVFIRDIEKDWELVRKNPNNEFYLLEDCKQGISWSLLLEKKQRLLWFEVIHADFSGDIPECDKK